MRWSIRARWSATGWPAPEAVTPEPRPDAPETPGLLLACALATLAGATDAYGLAYLHGLFVSFMSGDTTMLGVALGRGEAARAGGIAGLVALFVSGAAGGTVVGILAGRRHMEAVLLAATLLLCVPQAAPATTALAMTLAMGALNAALHRAGPVSVSLTYITGTLVNFGQGLGRWICGRREGWDWLAQSVSWVGILAGAVVATVLQQRLGQQATWPLAAYAAAVTIVAALTRARAPKGQLSGE